MNDIDTRGGRLRMRRSRGAMSGFLLVLLGIWGALIPFVGPYFDFAYSPDQAWVWTSARGWLEVLPGAATVLGGLLLLGSGNRATAMFGGWLAALAGAWFVVGRALAGPLGIGDPGMPMAVTDDKRVALELAFFSALGAVILFLAAMALGRLSMRSVRDLEYAQSEYTRRPVATDTAVTAEPAAEPTTAVPAAPKRRAWGGFGRRHTHAH
ncbi:hypothetical protein M1247_08470 [Mycobacterium sp. 21AC1]|uniref:hypothetical protein n=1 Tax=[Mycobacterium] appelbergii TaxID=2939269 RepID=UPI002938F7BF|nr:hypothetical protein [Mycobacterium sp. 21AC1]MDV3124943.1 hypothetical protein [Mycobacterium sp. 21AC1]